MKWFLLGVVFGMALILWGAYEFATHGYVDFRADQQPSASEFRVAMAAVDAYMMRYAPNVKNPVPPTEQNVATGAKIYLDRCAGCHGVPSNPESRFSRSFYPPAPGFFKDSPDMPDRHNFYVVQHGIRWTGMPAWNGTLSDTEMWEVVTFLGAIDNLPPSARNVFAPAVAAAPPLSKAGAMQMPMPMH
jgi:mono/diheme cytochrome c family protein